MADRVVLLRDGRIEQDGSPEELYARPATAFTARFIGAPPMNLLGWPTAPAGRSCGGHRRAAGARRRGDGLLPACAPRTCGLRGRRWGPARR